MGLWKIVRPKAGTNLLTNPSFELGDTGYAGGLGDTLNLVSSISLYGGYSIEVEAGGSGATKMQIAGYTLAASTTYILSAWVNVFPGWDGGDIFMDASGYTGATETILSQWTSGTSPYNTWVRLATKIVNAADTSGDLQVISSSTPTGGRIFYTDGWDLKVASTLETYVDGDQPGCFWNGIPHESTSTRLQYDRRGGEILDLEDDLYFRVQYASGVGMVESKNLTQPISSQGGATYGGNQTQPRYFSLTGVFNGGNDDIATYHSRKRALLKALNPKTNTDVDDTPLPVILHYTGSSTTKEISAYYDEGWKGRSRCPIGRAILPCALRPLTRFFMT